MDVLWEARHHQSNLVGNVLNVNTGDWIRRDSGVRIDLPRIILQVFPTRLGLALTRITST